MATPNPGTASAAPRTPLRASTERIRGSAAEAQLEECIDLLQHPDVLANDLAEAYVLLDSCGEPPQPPTAPDEDPEEISLERFHAGDRIQVVGAESAELRLLAGQLDPIADAGFGLDYVGMQVDPDPAPVLGAVAKVDESTPYSVLMRLLCCFTEMAPPAMLAFWDEHLFKGALGDSPRFHLHLGLWSPSEMTVRGLGPAHFSLQELTRDLAALVREACRESPPLGSYLASITCLELDPEDSDGPLAFQWRV
jgi:hypothetical protein